MSRGKNGNTRERGGDRAIDGENGELSSTNEGKNFLSTIASKFAEDDDPMLVLFWDNDVLDSLLLDMQGRNIANLSCPEYIDLSSKENFTTAILEHLQELGGGRTGNTIGPNTFIQFCNVVTRLRDIECDPFVQMLVAMADAPLASCGVIMGTVPAAPIPMQRIRPKAPLRQVFV